MSEELQKKYRPDDFTQMIGQTEAVKTILGLFKRPGGLPHAVLLTGPSGTGKTTMARIIKDRLKCGDHDYQEIDCPAVEKVLDEVRSIKQMMKKRGISGPTRVVLFDEVQSLSRTSFAQQAMLQMLEGAPDHAYYILATTDPSKVIAAIKSRCTEIKLKPLTPKHIGDLLVNVSEQENFPLDAKLGSRIAEVADGSARKALVILEQVMGLKDDTERLNAVRSSDLKVKAFDLVKELMPFKGKPNWTKCSAILESLRGEDPEGLRQLVLQVATTHVLKGGPMSAKAFPILQAFRDYDLSDTPIAKFASLVANCFELCNPA